MFKSLVYLLSAIALLRPCAAQAAQGPWVEGQINSTMCYWTQPRAAIIRDTAYIDGGDLNFLPGMSDGTYGDPGSDGNPKGLVYLLNFSIPFNTSSNFTSVFTTISKASGSAGANANNIGPNYIDGGMFANDYEWITYGGMVSLTDAFSSPNEDSVAAYEAYDNRKAPQFSPSYVVKDLNDDVTRYLTYGATASTPSENLGFYFSGMRSTSGGPINWNVPTANASINADTVSNTMIQLNFNVEKAETWSNLTLPSSVPGRASAELVWVPVSEKGILVAIGGVVEPAFANINKTDTAAEKAISSSTSPTFIETVAVYDIANAVWYEQPTSGQFPGALSQGCTVMASAQDGSSHNIYWYGGYDGVDTTQSFNDDVWILSIPSFMWMRATPGTGVGRAGHKCVKPYPDQMLVIGGYAPLSGSGPPACLDGGLIRIFNLSSTEWITSYNPTIWSNYSVPSSIVDMIGGSATGSATMASPTSGFASSNMTSLFGTKYNTSKIVDWFPYQLAATTSNNSTTSSLPQPTTKSSTPKFLAPVLAVVLGLFFITLAVLIILLWRRRRYLRSQPAQSEAGTMDNRFWVANWLRGTPQDHKAVTVTTDETDEGAPMSPYDDVYTDNNKSEAAEVAGIQVHELMDTSRPVEIDSTGSTGFVAIHGRQSSTNSNHYNRGLTSSPSVASHTSRTSEVSRESYSPRPGLANMIPRADSPSLGDQRFTSGVSNVSETDRGHLRGISETSISTDGNFATPIGGEGGARPGEPDRPRGVVSPLTPPEGVDATTDYMTAGSTSGSPSGKRKSNFNEELDK